jgi:hypothetical protein
VTPYEIIHEVRKHGWLLLMGNGRLHVELPAGHKELLAELKTQKERVRAVLVARQDAKKKQKALRPAPPPLVGKPVSIPMACTCRKHPYPHIHSRIDLNDPDEVVVVTARSGDAVWSRLKRQVAIAHEKSKNSGFDDYAFELTQAMPPIALHGPNVHCERPAEGIKPGESIQIMVGREAVLPPKKSDLSPWGKPKIKGYAKYRWDDTPKASSTDSLAPSLLPIGIRVTAIEHDWVLGWIEWRTRATDCEYIYGRRVRFQEYPSSRGEATCVVTTKDTSGCSGS